MRIIVASRPDRAYFFGMVPTAWALRAAGHEVRIAVQPPMVEEAVETGLTVMPLGGGTVGGGEPWSGGKDLWVNDLVAFCREWEPDLVLWEASTYEGAVAAQASGAAHGRFLSGPDTRPSPAPLRKWMDETVQRLGLTPTPSLFSGHFSVCTLPEGLAGRSPRGGVPRLCVRPVPYRGAASLPSWARGSTQGVRVLVDGASWTRSPQGTEALARAVALPGVETVFLPSGTAEAGPPLPEGVRTAEASSLHLLLETASAVVHGGSHDVVCTAALRGTAQVAVIDPGSWGSHTLIRVAEERGCAAVLTVDEVLGGSLPEAVSRMLDADRGALESLRKEMEGVPAPDELVPVLEEYAERFRDRRRPTGIR